jgi:intein/homing endonuclease
VHKRLPLVRDVPQYMDELLKQVIIRPAMNERRVAVRLYGVRFAEVGRVRFSNGVELVGTADHPIFTPSGLIRLSDLKIGDFVNSAVSVVSTWEAVGRDTVYNLQVADTPEYFANGILVVTSWRAGQINSKHGTI